MLLQLFVGSVVIFISVLIEVSFIYFAVKEIKALRLRAAFRSDLITMMAYLGAVTLWLLLAFSIVTWVWAFTLLSLGSFATLEQALYFSMVAFTSLGLGDLLLEHDWRLLSGMIAANGLLLFGLNTAILVEVLRELLKAREKRQQEEME